MLNKDEFLRDMEFAARRYGSSYKNAIRWEMEAENLDFDDISDLRMFLGTWVRQEELEQLISFLILSDLDPVMMYTRSFDSMWDAGVIAVKVIEA
jgi:hypothetical protein